MNKKYRPYGILVRSEKLSVGDVILTSYSEWSSKCVEILSRGTYSHAAIVVNQGLLFESDKSIIGFKMLNWIGYGVARGEHTTLAIPVNCCTKLSVRRHTGLARLPKESINKAFEAEYSESYGCEYPPLARLLDASNLNIFLKNVLGAFATVGKKGPVNNKISGPFCSELVARFYERLGLDLFGSHRPAGSISPNQLAQSNLVELSDVVVEAGDVSSWRPLLPAMAEAVACLAEIYAPEGDVVAHNRRNQRIFRKHLNEFKGLVAEATKAGAKELASLRGTVQTQLESVLALREEEQSRSGDALKRWIERLCEQYSNLLHRLLNVPEGNIDERQVSNAVNEFQRLGIWYLRCLIISGSKRLKCARLASEDAKDRRRLRQIRIKILKDARRMLQAEMTRDPFEGSSYG